MGVSSLPQFELYADSFECQALNQADASRQIETMLMASNINAHMASNTLPWTMDDTRLIPNNRATIDNVIMAKIMVGFL